MKIIAFFSLALLALATGCDCQNNCQPAAANTNTTSGDGSIATAPVEYLGTITKQQQSAVKTIDTAAINQAIQLFQVQEGRLPRDLSELVEKQYLKQLPPTPYGTKLEYDANAGKVQVVKTP